VREEWYLRILAFISISHSPPHISYQSVWQTPSHSHNVPSFTFSTSNTSSILITRSPETPSTHQPQTRQIINPPSRPQESILPASQHERLPVPVPEEMVDRALSIVVIPDVRPVHPERFLRDAVPAFQFTSAIDAPLPTPSRFNSPPTPYPLHL